MLFAFTQRSPVLNRLLADDQLEGMRGQVLPDAARHGARLPAGARFRRAGVRLPDARTDRVDAAALSTTRTTTGCSLLSRAVLLRRYCSLAGVALVA